MSTFTFDSGVLSSNPMSFVISDPTASEFIDLNYVTISNVNFPNDLTLLSATCSPILEFDVTMPDGSPITSNPHVIFDVAVPNLILHNDDFTTANTVESFKLHVKYKGALYSFGDYSTTSYLDF